MNLNKFLVPWIRVCNHHLQKQPFIMLQWKIKREEINAQFDKVDREEQREEPLQRL